MAARTSKISPSGFHAAIFSRDFLSRHGRRTQNSASLNACIADMCANFNDGNRWLNSILRWLEFRRSTLNPVTDVS